MKRKLLPLAVGAAIAVPSLAMADGHGPKVYGKVNVSYENVEEADADAWELISNASRLGVKGKEKISDDLQAVYKMEFEVSVDDGDKSGQTLTQRNVYGGLKGGFGQVIAGKFDTPVKKAQGKVDMFNDLSGDIKNLVSGENRQSNTVQYSTPKIADALTVNVAVMPGEEAGSDNDGFADHISASVVFKQDGMYAAVAMDDDVKGKDTVRLVGQFKMDTITVGALYNMSEMSEGDGPEETGIIVSASVKMGSGKIKAQFGTSTTEEDGAEDEDKTQIAFGYDHKLSKKSKVYAYYNNIETEVGSSSGDETNFGVGVETKF